MRQEEDEILYCIEQFGTLTRNQLLRFIKKERNVTDKILSNLVKRGYIFTKNDYFSSTPKMEYNERMIEAFWVMAQFNEEINPKEYYVANYPAQIFFIKDNKPYEIISFKPGDENLISIISHRAKISNEEIRYIFAVNCESILSDIPPLPFDAVFAVVDDSYVKFYTPSNINSEV